MIKIHKIFLIACLLASFILVSCSTPSTLDTESLTRTKTELKDSEKIVEGQEKTIRDSSTTIDESVRIIRNETNNIRKIVPKEFIPEVEPNVSSIEDQADTIASQSEKLKIVASELNAARIKMLAAIDKMEVIEGQVSKVVAERDKYKKELDEALIEQKSETRKMLRWLIMSCVVAGGISIALMMFGNFAIGGILLSASASTLGLAIAVDQYFDYIAIGGLVVLALAAGYCVYQIWSRQRALRELVQTTEIAKRKMPFEERKKIFGYREEPGLATTIQSPPTEKLVNNIRKQLRKSWEHTVNDEDARTMDMFEHEHSDHIIENAERKAKARRRPNMTVDK